VSTVRWVASGTDVLPPAFTSTLFSHIAKLALRREPTEVAEAVRMTVRERAVFDLIADGLSNKEIAERSTSHQHVKGTSTTSWRSSPCIRGCRSRRTRGAAVVRGSISLVQTDSPIGPTPPTQTNRFFFPPRIRSSASHHRHIRHRSSPIKGINAGSGARPLGGLCVTRF